MKASNFLSLGKMMARLNRRNNICINGFCCAKNMIYPASLSDQRFEDCMDLSMITNENKLHYVYIQDFNIYVQ